MWFKLWLVLNIMDIDNIDIYFEYNEYICQGIEKKDTNF